MSAANEVMFLLNVNDPLCIGDLANYIFSTRDAFCAISQ